MHLAAKRAPRSAAAKPITTTWLHQVGRELKPLVSESVVHANENPLPHGAVGFTPTNLVQAISGNSLVVGTFRARDAASGDRWLLVANRSHSTRTRATITLNNQAVASAGIFRPAKQTYPPHRTGSIPVDLSPGAATLIKLTTN